jgi:hypothetical protein
MSDDQTPINARPRRQRPEALEDLSLSLRDNVFWRVEDYFRSLDEVGRAIVAGGAVVVALAVGIGGYSLASSGGDGSATTPTVAVQSASAPQPEPVEAAPKPKPDPTLQGAAPVFKAPADEGSAEAGGSKASADESGSAVGAANTGNPATDTFSTTAPAQPAATGATASGAASVEGPPAGPAAIAVARKFADAFVVYETGAEKSEVRKAFKATASPAVTKALLQRPPRQPAGVKVPKAKVLNVVPAPSHDRLYPVSVSLLRVGATSELRLEMEQLKNKQWRVVNVLG